MRLADKKDIAQITTLYSEALEHAKRVGHIDWPDPFRVKDVEQFVSTQELYCFGHQALEGVARVSTLPDSRIWNVPRGHAIYLSKIATANAVRGNRYVENMMLPNIRRSVGNNPPVRLDCLTDNPGLKNFYSSIGFAAVGDITFYSEKQRKHVSVCRFEMA